MARQTVPKNLNSLTVFCWKFFRVLETSGPKWSFFDSEKYFFFTTSKSASSKSGDPLQEYFPDVRLLSISAKYDLSSLRHFALEAFSFASNNSDDKSRKAFSIFSSNLEAIWSSNFSLIAWSLSDLMVLMWLFNLLLDNGKADLKLRIFWRIVAMISSSSLVAFNVSVSKVGWMPMTKLELFCIKSLY